MIDFTVEIKYDHALFLAQTIDAKLATPPGDATVVPGGFTVATKRARHIVAALRTAGLSCERIYSGPMVMRSTPRNLAALQS